MKVRVQFTGQLRTALGRAEEEVDLPEGSSVAELLKFLARELEGAAPHLLAGSGQLQHGLLTVINEIAVAAPQAAGVKLRSGDVLTLLPPIAGG